jgi:putative RNA 2'-phosphotransferase
MPPLTSSNHCRARPDQGEARTRRPCPGQASHRHTAVHNGFDNTPRGVYKHAGTFMSLAKTSKFLSLVLRHDPGRIGIVLDRAGWTNLEALIAACAAHGVALSRDEIVQVVASSDKQRFALSPDGVMIRANQGHSVTVELGLPAATPPSRLYHGTVADVLDSIEAEGLTKRSRHHVHLSAHPGTASQVGARRGQPVVLTIRADAMVAAGHQFFLSDNGVWLTDEVPPKFVEIPDTGAISDYGDSPRGRRVQIAESTLTACGVGWYVNSHGDRVDIAAAIASATAGTRLYQKAPTAAPTTRSAGVIAVSEETTMQAVYRLALDPHQHIGCLNFASARHPGGSFRDGVAAQEEALARSSALYPCLLEQPAYYRRNRENDSAMYQDLAIFSPRVPFLCSDDGDWLDQPVLASVISCPAPNAAALRQHGSYRADQVQQTLQRRAAMVLAIAASEGITALVLGAWGAGVFGNDPEMVAEVLSTALSPRRHDFDIVVFAVPPGPNAAAFATRFWLASRPAPARTTGE